VGNMCVYASLAFWQTLLRVLLLLLHVAAQV
jgi:hypothetical protein